MTRLPQSALAACALLGFMLCATVAVAQTQNAGEPKQLVEYRQAVMDSLGGHAAAIASIVKGQVKVDHLVNHAQAIADTAPVLADIWWQNSGPGDYKKTNALPKIWQQPKDFQEHVEAFQTAAKDFLLAAKTGERMTIIKGFKALGHSCGSCHDTYRHEK